MKNRITIRDVAERAGVSIKTVSRVLNNEPNVRVATQQKVREAAQALRYRPNLSARQLATSRSYLLGLLYDNPVPGYIIGIQEGALEACHKGGYNLLIRPCHVEADDLVDEVLDLVGRSMIDGFLLTPPISDKGVLLSALQRADVPIVRISQSPTLSSAPCVLVEDEDAVHDMVDHLIDQGHHRIAFLRGHPDHSSSYARERGFRAALKERGVEINESLFREGTYTFASGYDEGSFLLDLATPPSAIFAANDEMAIGVLRAAHEHGVAVPDELSICGYDDIPAASYAWPPLTTIRQPIVMASRLATELLIEMVGGKAVDSPIRRLGSELVIRASTGPA